jgi:hypothetical protein
VGYGFWIQGLGGRVQIFGEAASSCRHRSHILFVENRQFEQACAFDMIVEAGQNREDEICDALIPRFP